MRCDLTVSERNGEVIDAGKTETKLKKWERHTSWKTSGKDERRGDRSVGESTCRMRVRTRVQLARTPAKLRGTEANYNPSTQEIAGELDWPSR